MQRFITQPNFLLKFSCIFSSGNLKLHQHSFVTKKWMRCFNFICMNCISFWHRFYDEFCGNRNYLFFLFESEEGGEFNMRAIWVSIHFWFFIFLPIFLFNVMQELESMNEISWALRAYDMYHRTVNVTIATIT